MTESVDIVQAVARSVMEGFGLRGGRLRPEVCLTGSPERCVARSVVEDSSGGRWVLERLFGKQCAPREAVARIQSDLVAAGLRGVPAYRMAQPLSRDDAEGGAPGVGQPDARSQSHPSYHVHLQGAQWQLAPFVPGDTLPRPEYIEEAERGTALGQFLADMRRAAKHLVAPAAPSADLPGYVEGLLEAMRETRSDLLPAVVPLVWAVKPLFSAWDSVPQGLCHGDFHPLNVIWRGQDVAAVIDWEFAGRGPDLYDVANMLGCVGVEEPSALMRGLCRAFVQTLREGGVVREDNERWLHHLVVAVRFAWLSEWLRKGDLEMLETELLYMRLLANSADALGKAWAA